jgi:beta-aspartyl-peptidase (threonine type)
VFFRLVDRLSPQLKAAIMLMEDSPHFNAGFGAVLNEAGEHELDVSIMDGSNLAAGAVCAVRRTRHPVAAARAVNDSWNTPAVF